MEPSADFEIVAFVEPLALFGWGVLLVVRRGPVEVTAYLQTGDDVYGESFAAIAARYPPGRRLRLVAELSQTEDGALEVVEDTAPLGVRATRARPQSPAHDVVVTARVVEHLPEIDRLVLDAGLPLVTSWSDWTAAPPIGSAVRQSGDLWLVRAPPPAER